MQQLYVDFNTSAKDRERRYFVNLRDEPRVAETLRPGQRILLYDEVLQVEADLEYDEAAAKWWGRPDPSTYRDLPWPFQIRTDLTPDATGRVLIVPGVDERLEACLRPQSVADYLRPRFALILYDGASDVSAIVEERGPGEGWWVRTDWSNRRPRPYPYRISVETGAVWVPNALPIDPPALVLDEKAQEVLSDALRPGLLVVLLQVDSEYDAHIERDRTGGRWLARRTPRGQRYIPREWIPCLGQ